MDSPRKSRRRSMVHSAIISLRFLSRLTNGLLLDYPVQSLQLA